MMRKIENLFLPLVLLIIVGGSLIWGANIPASIKSVFYALSLSLKEILIFLLPLMVFAFVLHSVMRLGKGAVSFVLLLVPMMIISGIISTNLAYYLGSGWLEISCFSCRIPVNSDSIIPLWYFPLPKVISNDVALACGLASGVFLAWRPHKWAVTFSSWLLKLVESFLSKVFVPLIPLFLLGFALNMQQSGILGLMVTSYGRVFAGFVLLCFGYIILLYGALQGFHPVRWFSSLRNMVPAVLAGFSTMSSAAAMPLTLLGAEKNTSDQKVIQTVIPSTVNVHLVGDCFAIPVFALAIMISFGHGIPSCGTFFLFSIWFVMAKFAVAAVPGGGILVMLPLLERYLGFTPEMLSLVTALYILFDPVITSANILGNGAFAQLFARAFACMEAGKSKPVLFR